MRLMFWKKSDKAGVSPGPLLFPVSIRLHTFALLPELRKRTTVDTLNPQAGNDSAKGEDYERHSLQADDGKWSVAARR